MKCPFLPQQRVFVQIEISRQKLYIRVVGHSHRPDDTGKNERVFGPVLPGLTKVDLNTTEVLGPAERICKKEPGGLTISKKHQREQKTNIEKHSFKKMKFTKTALTLIASAHLVAVAVAGGDARNHLRKATTISDAPVAGGNPSSKRALSKKGRRQQVDGTGPRKLKKGGKKGGAGGTSAPPTAKPVGDKPTKKATGTKTKPIKSKDKQGSLPAFQLKPKDTTTHHQTNHHHNANFDINIVGGTGAGSNEFPYFGKFLDGPHGWLLQWETPL